MFIKDMLHCCLRVEKSADNLHCTFLGEQAGDKFEYIKLCIVRLGEQGEDKLQLEKRVAICAP